MSTNAAPPIAPIRPQPEFEVPAQVTPYSQLGTPVERLRWWAPLGWLLVIVVTVLTYALLILLVPLMLLSIAARRVWVRRLTYRRRPEDLRVAIIGAGWSGLQCLARFRTLGVANVDVFERYDDIGGTWNPNLSYHGLQIHGSMTVTSFDGFPYSTDPDVQGGKVMAEEVERYIHRFADDRELLDRCRLHSNVDALSYRSQDRTATLSVTDTRTAEQRTAGPYDMVIWASMAAFGSIPKLKGSEGFEGRQLHTVQFKTADLEDIVRNDRRVVVIGGGKAACDVVLAFRRAGYENFSWVMRKPYLFYKFEALLHNASPMSKLRGVTYLPTALWCGLSKKLGAILHWSSGYLYTYGDAHTDFNHFHGGVLCPTQRKEIAEIPYTIGDPVRLQADRVVLRDGRELEGDVVVWATGNQSGIDTLKLVKDGEPMTLSRTAKLYNHFIVPQLPAFASATALWTTFGPMRATNSADLAVYHLCVRKERSQQQMERAARRQISDNSILHSFIWAHDACWLQQWVHFHIDLVMQGITPIEAFIKHAIEIFVLAKETPLRFNLLPRDGAPGPPVSAAVPASPGPGGPAD